MDEELRDKLVAVWVDHKIGRRLVFSRDEAMAIFMEFAEFLMALKYGGSEKGTPHDRLKVVRAS